MGGGSREREAQDTGGFIGNPGEMPLLFVAEPDLFGESSDAAYRQRS
jgi:hypothetical protein